MNQCVPSWDLDDAAAGGLNTASAATDGVHHRAGVDGAGVSFSPLVVPMSDRYYDVAELTWEKGNISSHGLLNRPAPTKCPPAASSTRLQALGGGGEPAGGGDRETLEAVVGEAAARSHFPAQPSLPATPWLGLGAPLPADALVPCATRDDQAAEEEARRKRARVVGEDGHGLLCASQGSTATGRRGESALPALDAACGTGDDDVCGFTTTTNNSTSLDRDDNKGSPDTENTSIGGGASDSRCFSLRSQRDGLCDEGENVVINGEPAMRSSVSTKRSRAAAIHNESERVRKLSPFWFTQCSRRHELETKGQDQPEDENSAEARPKLEQDRQGVDAGRGDRLPEAAAGAGAGDEPDEQHDDAHGHAAAADVRLGADGPDGPDGADGPGDDEHGLPLPAGLCAAAHDAPASPALRPPALGRGRRRGKLWRRRGGRPRAAARRQRHHPGRLRGLPRVPTSAAEWPAAATGRHGGVQQDVGDVA